jgi:hypothetical protein
MSSLSAENPVYQYQALLTYATPEHGFQDQHYIDLAAPDPGGISEVVEDSLARDHLAFFYIARCALVTINHSEITDPTQISGVAFSEKLHGRRVLSEGHLVVGDTDGAFQLATENAIAE